MVLRCLLFLFSVGTLFGISQPSSRRLLLEAGEQMLHQGSSEKRLEIDRLSSPFALKAIPEIQAVGDVDVGGSSDPDILRRVAASLHPTGTIVKGDKRLLLFDENSLEDGDIIKITLQGKIYRVRVEKVERNAYTLRLNSSTYTQSLVKIDPKNVKFDE